MREKRIKAETMNEKTEHVFRSWKVRTWLSQDTCVYTAVHKSPDIYYIYISAIYEYVNFEKLIIDLFRK